MTFEEASAFVHGSNGFGWIQVHYDYDSGAWVATSDQTGTTEPLGAGSRLAAQDEALARYGRKAVGNWVFSGSDEDGAKVVTV
jgi:hypothetical protein